MAYDAARRNVVLFGGYSNGVLRNDTWVWDGASWVEKTPGHSPTPRSGAGISYDAAMGKVILFGGAGGQASQSWLNDTWAWDGITWTRLSPLASPPGRAYMSIAYDPDEREIVLFGGAGSAGYLGDTWTFDGSTWIQLAPQVSPSARMSAMTHDSGRHLTVLFGGGDGGSYLSDTWAWSGSNWTELAPTTSPPGRVSNGIARVGRFVVIFGGYEGSGSVLGDTWYWTGTTWEEFPGAGPAARSGLRLATDVAAGDVVMFGGAGFLKGFTDTWTLEP